MKATIAGDGLAPDDPNVKLVEEKGFHFIPRHEAGQPRTAVQPVRSQRGAEITGEAQQEWHERKDEGVPVDHRPPAQAKHGDACHAGRLRRTGHRERDVRALKARDKCRSKAGSRNGKTV